MADRARATAAVGKKSFLTSVRTWFGSGRAPGTPVPMLEVPSARPGQTSAGGPKAPLSRLTVAQWLWGDGFIMPGGAEFVLDLVKPFGLTPAMSMLDLSAGLGGPARAIAQAFGTYVTGLERSAERAKLGMAMSNKANLQKKAAIGQYNPESVELRPNGFDCILGRGATYSVAEKERLLRVLYQGMKQRGQLLLNEFTIDHTPGARPELAAWMAKESYPPVLWTVEQYNDCLTSLGFDIRVVEDITGTYRAMIIAGWARLLKEVDLRGLSRDHLLVVVDEAELWMKRVAALECGALRVYRIYALVNKPAR
jgi:cyclopropane fatty-acyl-phospholipid synthase-like methyltransferase